MVLEPDKLSALMADMVSLTNRTSSSLGTGPFPPIRSPEPSSTGSSPPDQRPPGNAVKRKHHTLTQYVFMSL